MVTAHADPDMPSTSPSPRCRKSDQLQCPGQEAPGVERRGKWTDQSLPGRSQQSSGVLHSQTSKEGPSDEYSLGRHQEVVRGQTPQRCLSTLNSFLQTSISSCLAPLPQAHLPPHYRAAAEQRVGQTQEETAQQIPPHPGVLCPGSWDSCEQTLQVGLSRVLAQLQGELPGLMAFATGCNCIPSHTTPLYPGIGEDEHRIVSAGLVISNNLHVHITHTHPRVGAHRKQKPNTGVL